MSTNSPIMIPETITGTQAQFLDPQSVHFVVGTYGSLTFILQAGRKVEFKPEMAARKTATADALALMFSPETIAKMHELEKITGKMINPDAIQSINFLGGVIHFNLRGGDSVTSKPVAFFHYKSAVEVVYGKDAASNLQPLAPPKPKAVDRAVPKGEPARSFEDHHERLIQAAHNLPKARTAAPLPKILSTSREARVDSIGRVLERLSALLCGLRGCDTFMVGNEAWPALTRFADAVGILDRANARLYSDNNSAALEAFREAVAAATGALSQLPNSPQVVHIGKLIAAELGRFSDLHLSKDSAVAA